MKRRKDEPVWVTSELVCMLHGESLRHFRGSPGLRDPGLLDSALARTRQRCVYDDHADLFDLAAEIAYGIARNFPFVDGNKRAALLSVRAFLFLNGFRFVPGQVEPVTTFELLSAGEVDVAWLGGWIRRNCSPRR